MEYSCFTSYGQLEYSSDLPDAEKIYNAARAGYVDPVSGRESIDLSPGSYHESKIYARSMAIADALASVKRARRQAIARTSTEALPHFERRYRLVPRANASLAERRAAAAARQLVNRGSRYEAIFDGLQRIFGASLITLRPVVVTEATSWPTSPSSGPGVFRRADAVAKTIRLVDPVVKTGVPSTIRYENWDTTEVPVQLVAGDVLCFQPETLGLAEKVAITSVSGTGTGRTLTATFTRSHDEGASATTGPAPIWWSETGHLFVVVDHDAAVDAKLFDAANELLTRVMKAGVTWSIVEPTTPSADTIGPFELGASPLGAVTVGEIDVTPVPPAAIRKVSPSSGPAAGGTAVRIYGNFFAGTTDVLVAAASTPFTLISERVIEIVTPAHAAGSVSIAVVTPAGTFTKANAFTYV